jgi:hypothetical protein
LWAEFAEIRANFRVTYKTFEIEKVLRLIEEKARRCPEERAGLSQPRDLRLDGMKPTQTLTAGTLILCFESANFCAVRAPDRRGFIKNPAAFRIKNALPPD